MGKKRRDNDAASEREHAQRDDRYALSDISDAGDLRPYDDEQRDDLYDAAPRRSSGALVPRDEALPAPADHDGHQHAHPLIIAGSGVSMGNPFITRRERPLTMRLAIITLILCILGSGLFAASPLEASAEGSLSSFQAIGGAVVLHRDVTYHWYTAQPGDAIELIAQKFQVQIGGILELNNMLAGQDMMVGKQYKIPDDPFYGKDYRPASYPMHGSGTTTFGGDWWSSYVGTPNPGTPCPAGDPNNPTSFHFISPNPGSYFVRGFSWFHNGVDIAAAYGNPIRAAQYGQVIWAGWTNTGFGYSVRISHCNHISTLYGHMEEVLVHAGDFVKPGTVIGLEGSTGWSTGPHLHLSVLYDNDFLDPLQFYNYNIGAVTDLGTPTPAQVAFAVQYHYVTLNQVTSCSGNAVPNMFSVLPNAPAQPQVSSRKLRRCPVRRCCCGCCSAS